MTMQPEEAIRVRVLAGGARAWIGDRFYPQRAPQNAPRPYAVFRRISGSPERHMRGAAAIAHARIQVGIYAETYALAKAIADAVRVSLDGFKGEVAVGAGPFYIRHLSLQNDVDDFIEPQDGSDGGIHVVSQDWQIFYVLPASTFTA